MAINYLEQLVAEWYEYQGCFVRRNIHVGKRPKGGYECELDLVAFNPALRHLVHIEPSMDADSWKKEKCDTRKSSNQGENTYRNCLKDSNYQIISSKSRYLDLPVGKIIKPSLVEEYF